MRRLLILLAAVLALTLAACGGGSDSDGSTLSEATTSAATGAAAATGDESSGAPCTKKAIAAGAQSSFGNEKIEILGGFVCEGGWASGPVLVGPSGSEEQIEAAFLVKAENGKWTVPTKLPCDSGEVPEKVLANSPCRVS